MGWASRANPQARLVRERTPEGRLRVLAGLVRDEDHLEQVTAGIPDEDEREAVRAKLRGYRMLMGPSWSQRSDLFS